MVRPSTSCPERVVRFALRLLGRATASAGVAALVLTTGCYTYEVRAPGEIPAGRHVIVAVTAQGAAALAPDLGDGVTSVEGDIISADENGIRLHVSDVEYVAGNSGHIPGADVNVPRNAVVVVTTKQFSRSKTAAVAVGLGLALIAAIRASGVIGSGSSDSPSKPPPAPGTQ